MRYGHVLIKQKKSGNYRIEGLGGYTKLEEKSVKLMKMLLHVGRDGNTM